MLEAWDARKPVVASYAVALVENFKTGVITTHKEPSSIAWGLNYVLEGLGRNRMGKTGMIFSKRNITEKQYLERPLKYMKK